MKTWTCKKPGCGYSAEGTSPSVLITHARDVHGASRGGRRRRRNAQAAADAAVDKEVTLLTKCVELFNHVGTTPAEDARVLVYLNARYGPEAYADDGDAVDEEPADE